MTLFCPKCHVELNDDHSRCPLCEAELQENVPDDEISFDTYPKHTPTTQLETTNSFEILIKEAWEIFSIVLLIAILIVFFTDFITHNAITWSRFVILSVAFAWTVISGLVFLMRYIWLLMIELTVTVSLFLLLLDYFNSDQLTWFVPLAFPATLLSIISISICVGFAKFEQRLLFRLAFIIFIIGLYTVAIDLIITYFNTQILVVTWSRYVIVPLVLLAAFLIYVKYRFLADDEQVAKLKAKFMI